jgi:predicted transposase YdaD
MPDPPPRRPGPVYDDAMKILAEDDLTALLSVVGVTGPAQPLEPASAVSVELPASTRKADLVATTPDGLVHVEFVKDPAPDLDLRMVEYRVRLRRRDRSVQLRQFVLVLRDIPVKAAYDDPGPDPMTAGWTVVRLDRVDPQALLAAGPVTAALAALAAGSPDERARALAAAAALISQDLDRDRRDVLLGAAATLASIVLPADTIKRATKEATMPVPIRETPLGREWLEEGRAEGREEGREEGRAEGRREAVVRATAALLRRRFGTDPRIDAAAAGLADLSDDERAARILDAPDLDALT